MKSRVFTLALVLTLAGCAKEIQFQPNGEAAAQKDSGAKQLVYPSSYDQRPPLSPGETEYANPVTSPNSAETIKAALTTVSCNQTPDDAISSSNRGFMLLPGSDLVIVSDQGDVSDKKIDPSVSVAHCESKTPLKDIAPSNQMQQLNLNIGEDTQDVVITSPANAKTAESSVLTVSCTKDPATTVQSGVNGVILVPGSKIILARDLNYKFADGSTSTGTPYVLVSCE